jgi:hypothetical protein
MTHWYLILVTFGDDWDTILYVISIFVNYLMLVENKSIWFDIWSFPT